MYILLSPTVEGISYATFYIHILVCFTSDLLPNFNVGTKYVRSVISHRYGITPKNEIVGGGGGTLVRFGAALTHVTNSMLIQSVGVRITSVSGLLHS